MASACILLAPAGSLAAPGATDSTFGAGGIARPSEQSNITVGVASDRDANGAVVVAGAGTSMSLATDEDDFSFDIRVHPTLYRFRADGSPDRAFGVDGAVRVRFNREDDPEFAESRGRSACTLAKLSTGVIARTTELGCDGAASAARSGIGPRAAARTLLGR